MRHEIKIGKDFATAILSGEKNFEIRKNDRGYQRGDTVVFRVIDKEGNEVEDHPLHGAAYEITYVLNGWGLRDGFCCFGIRPEEDSI